MIKTILACLAVLVGTLALAPTSVASGGSGSGKGGGVSSREVRMEARMRLARTEAKVAYREVTRGTTVSRTLQAEIERTTPNTKFAVLLNGKQIATVTTNALGVGHVEFERNVPVMKAGDKVAIGKLTGTLIVTR